VVHERSESVIVASLTLQRAGVKFTLRTRNERHPFERLVMRLEDGPFRRFQAEWRFRQLGEMGSKVEFDAEFDLANVPFSGAAGMLLESVTGKLVDSFRVRAAQVYPA
jgi:ribosome-associated toxin RatA of RatAB toxin-antitoxin module